MQNSAHLFARKYAQDRQHTLQVRALEHYSLTAPFHHRGYLGLLRHCLAGAFLHAEEQRFLSHLLGEYQVQYLDWCWRIPWLQAKIAAARASAPKPMPEYTQPLFGWYVPGNQKPPVQVPTHILPAQKSAARRLRAS
jgi:hypothetical protein